MSKVSFNFKDLNEISLKTWTCLIATLLALSFAAYMGANVNVNVSLEARLSAVERQLERELNSSFYGLQKPASYMISQVGSYTCLQNGTTGKLDDYSTNASYIINSAWKNGTSVFLKSGTYEISAPIMVPTAGALIGEVKSDQGSIVEHGAILSLVADCNVLNASHSPSESVRIAHLTIKGNRNNRTKGTGIYGKFRYSVFQDLYISDMDESGIIIEDVSDSVWCWDNCFEDINIWWVDEYGIKFSTRGTDQMIRGGHIAYAGIAGLFIDGVGGHRVDGLVIDTCGQQPTTSYGYGVQIDGGSGRFSDCNIAQNRAHGFYLKASTTNTLRATMIENCYMWSNSHVTAYQYDGIYLEGHDGTNPLAQVSIKGNKFIHANKQRYAINFAGTNEKNCTITDNDVLVGGVNGTINLNTNSTHMIIADNIGYNPIGYIANPVYASLYLDDSRGTAGIANDSQYICLGSAKNIYISGGTVVSVYVNGEVVFTTTNVTVHLVCGDTFEIVWSSAPTIKVMGS